MDWNTVNQAATPNNETPTLELVELCWQMRSLQKSSRILSCGIDRNNVPGF